MVAFSKGQNIQLSSILSQSKKQAIKPVSKSKGVYLVEQFSEKEVEILSLDNSFQFNPVRKKSPTQPPYTQYLIPLKDTVYYAYSTIFNGEFNLFIEGLDADLSEKLSILSIKEVTKENSKFQYSISQDRKAMVCFKSYATGNESKVNFVARSDSGQYLGDGEIALKYAFDNVRIKDVVCDESGTVYFLFQYRSPSKSRKERSYYNYELVKYDPVTKRYIHKRIDDSGVFITDLGIKNFPNGNILMTGYYSKTSFNLIEGVLDYHLDHEADTFIRQSLVPFDNNQLIKLSFNAVKSENEDINDFIVKEIVPKSDGGYLLLGESFYTTIVAYSSPNLYNSYSINNVTNYHFNDIFIVSINANGQKDWGKLIHKKQVVEDLNKQFASFSTVLTSDKIYILYNDDIGKRSKVKQVEIHKDGNFVERELDLSYIDIETCRQVSPKEVLFIKGEQELKVGKIVW